MAAASPSEATEERHLYDYPVDPTSDTAPARVCRMVGRGKKVLEIGAGPGSITRLLTEQGNEVTALEVDESAIPFLRKRCARVVSADLDQPDWTAQFGDERFDVVIAADVLEHLVDPWATLGRMKALLAEGGSLVISVPHASHACILACLLHEDVGYRDWGLLDRTHIRFFGLVNVAAMFEKAGLVPVRGEFVVRAPEQTEFAEQWSRLSEEARRFLGKQRFAQVYQIVVTAALPGDRRPPIDLLALDPHDFGQAREGLRERVASHVPAAGLDLARGLVGRLKRR